MNIAFFISSHGFGHAARSSAIIEKLIYEGHKIFIFTSVPEWFFNNSLISGDYEYFYQLTDIGLVQKTPFEEDIQMTIKALTNFFPPSQKELDFLKEKISHLKIDFIFSDISPLGIIISEILEIPSILIENFTWNWIYESYQLKFPDIKKWVTYFSEIYRKKMIHIQTIPFCGNDNNNFVVSPISRLPRTESMVIRNKLGISSNEKMILVTMGGIPVEQSPLMFQNLPQSYKVVFPVGNIKEETRLGNLIYLPHNHKFFHPDLVQAADLIIAKVGYSTLAEAYQQQTPILYLARENFRESKVLENFILTKMGGQSLSEKDLFNGGWIDKASDLFVTKSSKNEKPKNGVFEVMEIFNSQN